MNLVEEFERQSRVVDQMVTAHCGLRDRYEGLALCHDVSVLALSVALVSTTFLDPSVVAALGVSQDRIRLILGFVATVVLAATVVELRIRWKERGGMHRLAANTLSELKLSGRTIDPRSSTGEATAWLAEARRLLSRLPEIPERDFLRLKARHLRKIEVSKMLSQRPGASLNAIRFAVWRRATFSRSSPKRK